MRQQQRLMRLSSYLDRYIPAPYETPAQGSSPPSKRSRVSESPPRGAEDGGTVAVSAVVPVTAAHTEGYLAQHRLLDQIPELRGDLGELPYLKLGPRAAANHEPIDSLWIGPAGTVTPLHFDWHPNILCQLAGEKTVLILPPECSSDLYPTPEAPAADPKDTANPTIESQSWLRDPPIPRRQVENASQIDPEEPDLLAFPKAEAVLRDRLEVCHLRQGECLFLPPLWWHHVRAETASVSISHWF